MTRLVLCRHAEPEASAGRFCGSFDPALSAAGRAQAEELAVSLAADPLPVYTSPARRARETAEVLAPAPRVVDDVRELDFGEADGLTYDEVAERWPALYEQWLAAPTGVVFPGGERFDDFRRRVVAALEGLHRPALVVTHAGVIRTALAHWLAMPDEALFRIDAGYARVSAVEWQGDVPVVRLVNGSL